MSELYKIVGLGDFLVIHGVGNISVSVHVPDVVSIIRHGGMITFNMVNDSRFIEVKVCDSSSQVLSRHILEEISNYISDYHLRRYNDSQ